MAINQMINIHQIISNVDMITQQVGEVSFSHGYTTLSIYLHNVGKTHLLPQIIGKIIAKYENNKLEIQLPV